MRRLVPVQFFSWLALFAMWIYTTQPSRRFTSAQPTLNRKRTTRVPTGSAYCSARTTASPRSRPIVIPLVAARSGCARAPDQSVPRRLALISFRFIHDPSWLLLAMVGVGFAWASILSVPYALLSDGVPAQKMGLYMGIFNFFIVIPQLVAASVLGFLLNKLFGGAPIFALVLGGVSFMLAGLLRAARAGAGADSSPAIDDNPGYALPADFRTTGASAGSCSPVRRARSAADRRRAPHLRGACPASPS